MRLKLFVLLLFVLTLTSGSYSQTPATAQAPSPSAVVNAVLILRTSVSSKSSVGQEVKAVTKGPVTLPDGETLPKGTMLLGSVIAVVKHSKATPNGAVALDFTKAVAKGKDPIDVIVKIEKLSADDQNDEKTELPNSNGHMVASAGNSGGLAQLQSQANDHTNINGKVQNTSTIDGVFFSPTNKGAGAAFAKDEDVYLDSNIQMTVLMRLASEPAK